MLDLSLRKSLIDNTNCELSISDQCKLLGISRGSVYYKPKEPCCIDLAMMRLIDEWHLKDCTLGTRRLSVLLNRAGYKAGRQKVRSLMRTMRIKAVYCMPKTTISDPAKYKFPYLLRDLEVQRANQVWMIDISYIPMAQGFSYLFAIIDVYTRQIMNWDVSNTMESSWVCACIKEAINKHGTPEIINSDQGSQFTSSEYIDLIKSYSEIKISMDGKGRAIDNVYIERFFRTIKYEKLYLCTPVDITDVYQSCQEFITYYHNERVHSSLRYKTPFEFANDLKKKQMVA